MQKEDFYKRVKIAGMVAFIPIMLAAGPFAGYFTGDYLAKKTGLSYIIYICIGLGFMASIMEIARIIRIVTKISGKP